VWSFQASCPHAASNEQLLVAWTVDRASTRFSCFEDCCLFFRLLLLLLLLQEYTKWVASKKIMFCSGYFELSTYYQVRRAVTRHLQTARAALETIVTAVSLLLLHLKNHHPRLD
jgi:hypothetical protein